MKKTLSLFAFLLFIISAHAQINQVSLGNWRLHIPYRQGVAVAEDYKGKIYCAAQFGMFSYDNNTGEYEYYTTLTGLSDHEINNIRLDQASGILMITYSNSNIDLLLPDKTIINLPDIKQKNIVGGKGINSITFINGLAYLSCEFGIVIVDLHRYEIRGTYYIGANSSTVNVQGIAFDGTTLLAATEGGVYTANINDPTIFNSTAWTKDLSFAEPNGNFSSAAMISGKFFVVKANSAVYKDTLFINNNGVWTQFINETGFLAHVEDHNGYLMYSNWTEVIAMDVNANVVAGINIYNGPNFVLRRGVLTTNRELWIADHQNGLLLSTPSETYKFFTPNGPGAEAVFGMQALGGILWVASGSLEGDKPFYDNKNGMYKFSDERWKFFNLTNDSIYSLAAQRSPAVSGVAIDPNNNAHVYVAGYGAGVLEYVNDKGVALFNARNSPLGWAKTDTNDVRVGGLTFDSDGNLWIVTTYNTKAVTVRQQNGTWYSYNLPDPTMIDNVNLRPIVDDYGQKWFVSHKGASNGAGVYVFKEASLTSSAGVKLKALTTQSGSGNLPDLFVNVLAKDKDGAIWIGTNTGVAVIYNPGNVFSGSGFDAQKVILEQDGYAQYLLETESVTAIAVDPANRKWFGTASGGVFLMSADGTKQLRNYNIDNSPLPSNSISDIAINDITGEVFIGTDKGMISYLGDATAGGDECKDHLVFPNPVLHGYNGPIAIRGLLNNADVKIADVAGNIVYHTKANGGLATWNGMNYSGERAQTGVYTIYVSNEDGSQTCVTKLLFAR